MVVLSRIWMGILLSLRFSLLYCMKMAKASLNSTSLFGGKVVLVNRWDCMVKLASLLFAFVRLRSFAVR